MGGTFMDHQCRRAHLQPCYTDFENPTNDDMDYYLHGHGHG